MCSGVHIREVCARKGPLRDCCVYEDKMVTVLLLLVAAYAAQADYTG